MSCYYVRSCSVDHRGCTLSHRREQQSLPRDQLSPVDREVTRLSRASAKLYSFLYLATTVDKENSHIIIINIASNDAKYTLF